MKKRYILVEMETGDVLEHLSTQAGEDHAARIQRALDYYFRTERYTDKPDEHWFRRFRTADVTDLVADASPFADDVPVTDLLRRLS